MMLDRKDKRFVSCPVCGRILMKCQGECNIDITWEILQNNSQSSRGDV